jgi:hypothetical protein
MGGSDLGVLANAIDEWLRRLANGGDARRGAPLSFHRTRLARLILNTFNALFTVPEWRITEA